MRLSHDEEVILMKVCKDSGIPTKVLKDIFVTEEQYFYSDSTKKAVIIDEIIKTIQYWSKKEGEK